MAAGAARVLEGTTLGRQNAPAVAGRTQLEFEEAEAVAVASLAAGKRRAERVVALAAGADDELPHPPGRIQPTQGVERGEALVVMFVSHQHDLGAGLIQRRPQTPDGRVAAMGGAGTEARVVPERQRAAGRVGGQIGPQPALLLRTGLATADLVAVGVERDQMPASEVEAVPALAGLAGPWPEEPVVAAGVGGLVVVIARGRIGPVAEPTPARHIAARELVGRAVVVDGVAEGEHCTRQGVDQSPGLLVTVAVAAGDVAGGQQRGRPLP